MKIYAIMGEMANYSNSRVSTYDNCPYQYKLKYVDKVEAPTPTTIEMFLGDIVHRVMEKLYKDLQYQKTNTKEELLAFYQDLWKKEYSEDILIVKKEYSAENYKKMGEKFISDYYETYHPFDDVNIIGLETKDKLLLPDGNYWSVRIDKLGVDAENNYYVCDYKTNSRMIFQEQADADRQLAMYSVWVRDKFKDAKKIFLKWHMLAFNKEVISERTDEQLEQLQQDVVAKIKEIEQATADNKFPCNIDGLCNYCVYREICPSFSHLVQLEEKPPQEYKDDDGLKMVDEYAYLLGTVSELEKKKEALKEALIEFAKQKGIEGIFGTMSKVSVKKGETIKLPEDREAFIELLKEKGLYEKFSQINFSSLNSAHNKKELPAEVLKKLTVEESFRLTLSKRKELREE